MSTIGKTCTDYPQLQCYKWGLLCIYNKQTVNIILILNGAQLFCDFYGSFVGIRRKAISETFSLTDTNFHKLFCKYMTNSAINGSILPTRTASQSNVHITRTLIVPTAVQLLVQYTLIKMWPKINLVSALIINQHKVGAQQNFNVDFVY